MSTKRPFDIVFLEETVVRGEQNKLAETAQPTFEGARAALETFYYALNERAHGPFRQIWLDDPLIQLNNPLGGIVRGAEAIGALYGRIFEGPVRVQVEFYDIVAYVTSEMVVFAGRERGTYEREGKSSPLDIRTTRIFLYAPAQQGWRQIHHHGSIDVAEQLNKYQQAVLGSR
jgi:hypothetical protein